MEEQLTTREKAILTYEALQKRKIRRAKKEEAMKRNILYESIHRGANRL